MRKFTAAATVAALTLYAVVSANVVTLAGWGAVLLAIVAITTWAERDPFGA